MAFAVDDITVPECLTYPVKATLEQAVMNVCTALHSCGTGHGTTLDTASAYTIYDDSLVEASNCPWQQVGYEHHPLCYGEHVQPT
jgi:hypothetical protein